MYCRELRCILSYRTQNPVVREHRVGSNPTSGTVWNPVLCLGRKTSGRVDGELLLLAVLFLGNLGDLPTRSLGAGAASGAASGRRASRPLVAAPAGSRAAPPARARAAHRGPPRSATAPPMGSARRLPRPALSRQGRPSPSAQTSSGVRQGGTRWRRRAAWCPRVAVRAPQA